MLTEANTLLLEQNCTVSSGGIKSQVGSDVAVTGRSGVGCTLRLEDLFLFLTDPSLGDPRHSVTIAAFFSPVQRRHLLSFDFTGINGAL